MEMIVFRKKRKVENCNLPIQITNITRAYMNNCNIIKYYVWISYRVPVEL